MTTKNATSNRLLTIIGLILPWVLVLLCIPVTTYYVTPPLLRGLVIGVVIFSATVLFALALSAWKNRK